MTAFFHKYYMQLNELHSFRLGDAIHFHNELNQSIYDGDTMNPEVREQLLEIAEDFMEHLGIANVNISDITVSGSNAAYTYTRHSDIDLHILVDMNQFKNDDVYREFFDAKKTIYNERHHIKINDYDVELYVQDVNQPVISLGEYSVLNDKWIRLPRKRKAELDQTAAKLKFDKLYKLCDYALKSNDMGKIENVINVIKKYRQVGLDLNGEFSAENLAFKALRTKGIIKKLYARLQKLHSDRLSLPESKGNLLDKPEMTITQLASKHGVSKEHINSQLSKGIKVEMEHTSKYDVAKEIALDHLAEDPNYYTKLNKVDLEEGFDQPYATKWEKSDYGDVDVLAKLPDGSPLSIMFNKQQDSDGEEIIQVEFYRNNSQEVTGEGDAQRVFATVLTAIQKYIKKYKPARLSFSASKQVEQGQNSESRAKLYDRLVQRYAKALGYRAFRADNGDLVIYELSRINKPVAEASGYIPSEKEKNDPRWKTALTVDIKPDTMQKNAKKLGSKISRAGLPPLLRA